jgi:peptidyl-prolyl cis-trans isomerase A (cyclophilin A)
MVGACQKKNPVVEIQTPKGKLIVELDLANAPITAGNFLKLVEEGVYDGASFYRTVRNTKDKNSVPISVVQGGISRKPNSARVERIEHESTDITGLTHSNGVISMARSQPGTASSEFFICLGDNPELDFGGKRNPDLQGFAAFGKVIEGFQTLHDIWGSSAMGETIDPVVTIYKIKVQ